MRHPSVLLLLITMTACGRNSGPGITGEYFTRFEAVRPAAIDVPDHTDPGKIVDVLHDGRFVVDVPAHAGETGGVYVHDRDAGTWTPLDVEPVGVLGDRLLSYGNPPGPLQGSSNGEDWTEFPHPPELIRWSHAVDPFAEVLYVGGVVQQEVSSSGTTLTGRVYKSDDLGVTWEQVGGDYAAADPTAGDTELSFASVIGGLLTFSMCDYLTCRRYQTDGDQTTVLAEPDPLNIWGVDTDGLLLSNAGTLSSNMEAYRLREPDLDRIDEEMWVNTGFMPNTWVEELGMDRDHHLWRLGRGVDEELWLWRTPQPLGAAQDERSAVLGGRGCSDAFTRDRNATAGEFIDAELQNTGSERLYLAMVFGDFELGNHPLDGVSEAIEPGDTLHLSKREGEWWMVLTADGRCRGYGQLQDLDGQAFD